MANVDEKIVQCKKDLAAVQTNLTKLEAEKKLQETKLVPGDVASYNQELRLIVKDNDGKVFSVNRDGSFCIFESAFVEYAYRKISRISDYVK